jgi:hypothetical protein
VPVPDPEPDPDPCEVAHAVKKIATVNRRIAAKSLTDRWGDIFERPHLLREQHELRSDFLDETLG